MIFRRLEFGLLVRFILLVGMMYLTLHYLTQFTWLQVTTGIVVMLVQLWEMARYVTRSNRELARFLEAVKQRDFTQRFNEHNTNNSLQHLHQAFNQISSTYKQLQLEKEAQLHYMQTILQLIDTGIVAFDDAGEVEWVNNAFKNILAIPHLKNLVSLKTRYPDLYQAVLDLQLNENKLQKVKLPTGTSQLLLTSVAFNMQDRHLTLAAFKNVSSTIDETETEAWQKLLRVMTHEIMNSVAPIASLADSLGRVLKADRESYESEGQPPPNQELLQDTEEGISIIKKRSEGLLRFAHFYRNLNKAQHILLTTVYVQELFNSIGTLMHPRLKETGVKLSCEISSSDLTLNGDVTLLEQVLINLILNAQRAVREQEDPRVGLKAYRADNGKAVIEIQDNGTGIPEELMESIFIPFFTSHKDGSGIGLSLAKHIMLLHKGNIQVSSKEGQGSVFKLTF